MPTGLQRTLTVSCAIHLLVILALLFSPASWLSGEANDAELDVMTLRLGGPEGPGEGGLTPLGSRPIQEVIPLEEARRPQWIQPPTPTPPEMILPVPAEESRIRPEPEIEVETTPDEARGRTPTRGSELREGRAMAEIIHDIAPGADLAFHTAFTGQAEFAQGIIDLADAFLRTDCVRARCPPIICPVS